MNSISASEFFYTSPHKIIKINILIIIIPKIQNIALLILNWGLHFTQSLSFQFGALYFIAICKTIY